MQRKNTYWTLFILMLIFALTACSSTDSEPSAQPDQTSDSASRSDSPAEKPADTDEVPAGDAVDKPESDKVVEKDETQKPPSEGKEMAKKDETKNPLMTPTTNYDEAPAEVNVRFETTKGNFTVKLIRDWSPRGVDHMHHLVRIGYFDDIAFFRAIEGFMVQFGMHGDPRINELWANTNLPDEPVKTSNKRGYLSFAKSNMPNSRSTQLFINLVDNANLDNYGFSPIGQVVEGMSVVDSLYMGYGEGAPRGRGPSQMQISQQGNQYLKAEFPNLDYIKKAVIVD